MEFRLNRIFPVFEDGWTKNRLAPKRGICYGFPITRQVDLADDTSMVSTVYFAG